MHIYEKNGKEYPSVTTVLSLIEYNEELMMWANAMGFQHKKLSQLKEKSCSFGTLVHANLQGIVDPNNKASIEDTTPRTPLEKFDLEKSIKNFHSIFDTIQYETIYTEKTLISENDGYAGTLDWYCKIDDKNHLFDFKTSKRPYKNYLLQLGGYANLLEVNGYDYPDMAGIIIVNTFGSSIHYINKEELKKYTEIFLDLVKLYEKIKSVSFAFDK